MSTRHGLHSWHTFVVAVLLVSLLMMAVPALAVAAPPQGSISGYVYTSDGSTPVAGATICAEYYPAFGAAGFATSGADGSYSIMTLSAGQYVVHAIAANCQTEYYNNVRNEGDATPVAVTDPGDAPNINFTMAPTGSISGYIFEEDGTTPITGAEVVADYFDTSTFANSGYSAADGSYSIAGLVSGDYHVHAARSGFVTMWYDNVGSESEATRITVAAPADVPSIDFTLYNTANPVLVTFPDPNLEAAIRDAIGKPAGDIWESDLVGLASLSAISCGITDLSGLEHCTGLVALDLGYNQIDNLSALAGLNGLVTLILNGNQIDDVSPLVGLTNLTYLRLDENEIGDVAALAGLTKLTYLVLYSNQISDISPLAGLTNLTGLMLGNNQIGNNISPLAGLGNLVDLELSMNQISDLTCLSGFVWLNNLGLGGNQISDLSPLSSLTGLTRLDLSANQISDISALSSLTALTELGLGGNELSDLSTLSELTSLAYLELWENEISDIEPLVDNTGLGTDDVVCLWNNPLGSMTVNTWIPALQARGVVVYWDAVNQIPDQPSNVLPVNGGVDVGLTPVLESSAFSDPDASDSHCASQWQMTTTSGDYSSPVFTGADASNLTSIAVPSGMLNDSTAYYWHVRHQDNHGNWSEWSVETWFATFDADSVVTFPDPNLEAAIRHAIGKPSGDIYLSDLTALTTLSATELGIIDLAGLEHCTGLVALDLGYNQISDVSPLAGLPDLLNLGLAGNQISDLSPLSGLTSLTELYLGANQISDLSPLSGLTNLAALGLYGNQVSDLSPLSGLTSLTDILDLENNQISDLSPLSGLTGLMVLNIGINQISDLSPLSGLTSLAYLNCYENEVDDLSPLSGLSNLCVVDLRDNQVRDLSPLSGLAGLAYLGLASNQISDISPLINNAGLATGDEVNLRGNPLNSNSVNTWIPALQARGVSVYWDSVNNPPVRPSNVSPVSGDVGISLTPVLQSSAYFEFDALDPHSASQWQVRTSSGDYPGAVFDSGADAVNLTQISLPSGVLGQFTMYYWRVRYQDSRGDWSEWSTETSFTTLGSGPGGDGWYEYFNTSNTGTYVYGQDWRYQTFTPSTTHNLDTVSFYVYKQGAPDYTVTVAIYAVDANHKPTGSPLCTTTFAASSVTSRAIWHNCIFATGYPVSAGVEYAIVLSGDGGDGRNRVVVRVNTAGGYGGGMRGYSINGGAKWYVVSGQDMAFREGQNPLGNTGWYEQFAHSNTGTYVYGQDWRYQTFTPSMSHYLNTVSLYLYKQGAPDYTVTIGIYAVGAKHKPTGSPLCTTTFTASSLSTAASWRTYTFSSGCVVSAGVEYAIVLSGDGGNSSNRVVVRVNTVGGYSGGVRGYSLNGGTTWLLSSGQDMAFKEGQT